MNGVNGENVNERLDEAIKELGLTVRGFSIKTGIDNSNLAKKLQGKLGITKNDIRVIKNRTPINTDWLLTGLGPKFIDGRDIKVSNDEHRGVPFYDVDFNLGFEDMYETRENVETYIDVPGMNKATCWCRTTGNSMFPLINSGDLICLEEISDWQSFIINDDIYGIVATNGMRTVKKVVESEDRKSFRLIPINQDYHEQLIEKDKIFKVYHVIGILKRL